MLHVLSSAYCSQYDQIGGQLPEIAVCSGMVRDEWKQELLSCIEKAGLAAKWHDVSLTDYRMLESHIKEGDTAWVLFDGIETDGYPGITVIRYLEDLRGRRPFTLIGPDTAFYSQDKLVQKRLFFENRIPCPAYFVLNDRPSASRCFSFLFGEVKKSFIIKPYDLYCSVGISADSAVDNADDALRVYDRLSRATEHIIAEEFISGREFTVLCVGQGPLLKAYPPVERRFYGPRPDDLFMNFELTQLPHDLKNAMELLWVSDHDLSDALKTAALDACRAVGANAYARVDIRQDRVTGILYVLEVNACPSVGKESTIEEILNLNGLSFQSFLEDILAIGARQDSQDNGPRGDDFYQYDRVSLYHDPVKGRCIHTRKAVLRGQELFRASIDAFGVEEMYKRNYCHHCLEYSDKEYTINCPDCREVWYCSEECRAADSGHTAECGALAAFYAHDHGDREAVTYYRTNIQVLARLLDTPGTPLARLVTNYDKMGPGKQLWVWKIALKLSGLFPGKFPLSVVLAAVTSTDCNCFSADYDPDGVTLLSGGFAMLEHSCIPNAARRVRGRTVTVFALKDIPALSAVSISYISALYSRAVRAQNLAEYYYFQCGCPLCLSADDSIADEDLRLIADYYRKSPDFDAENPRRITVSSCYSFLSGGIVEHLDTACPDYPSILGANTYGKALFAARDLPAGTAVERFTGPVVPYSAVPDEEIRYALLVRDDEWMICPGNARYVNHSCEPNCKIGPELVIQTLRPVKKGEELTISYNSLSRGEYEDNPGFYFWDPRWNFDCRCGSPGCPGRIEGYNVR